MPPSNLLYGPSVQSNSPATPPSENTVAKGIAPLPATLAGDTTSEQVVLNPTNGQPLLVQIPSESGLEQTPFTIIASGYITTGGSLDVTMKLYEGTSATVGDDTELGSSSTVAQDSATAPFLMQATGVYDSVSGKLTGTTKFLINNSLVAETAFASVVDDISNSDNPVLSFLLSFTFGTAETTNLVNVQRFAIVG